MCQLMKCNVKTIFDQVPVAVELLPETVCLSIFWYDYKEKLRRAYQKRYPHQKRSKSAFQYNSNKIIIIFHRQLDWDPRLIRYFYDCTCPLYITRPGRQWYIKKMVNKREYSVIYWCLMRSADAQFSQIITWNRRWLCR